MENAILNKHNKYLIHHSYDIYKIQRFGYVLNEISPKKYFFCKKINIEQNRIAKANFNSYGI